MNDHCRDAGVSWLSSVLVDMVLLFIKGNIKVRRSEGSRNTHVPSKGFVTGIVIARGVEKGAGRNL